EISQRNAKSLRPAHTLKTARVRLTAVGMTNELERKLQRQLNIARTSAAQERIANGHIRRGCGRQESLSYGAAAGVRSWRQRALGIAWHWRHSAVGFQIHQEVRQRGVGEIWVIEKVKDIETELHLNVFAQFRVFGQPEIKVFEVRAHKGVAAKVA